VPGLPRGGERACERKLRLLGAATRRFACRVARRTAGRVEAPIQPGEAYSLDTLLAFLDS